MTELLERLKWVLVHHQFDTDFHALAQALVKEIETTHMIVDPEYVDEQMLDACFSALPAHYDPPDPKRRPWHAFKAKRRYTSMVKNAPRLIQK